MTRRASHAATTPQNPPHRRPLRGARPQPGAPRPTATRALHPSAVTTAPQARRVTGRDKLHTERAYSRQMRSGPGRRGSAAGAPAYAAPRPPDARRKEAHSGRPLPRTPSRAPADIGLMGVRASRPSTHGRRSRPPRTRRAPAHTGMPTGARTQASTDHTHTARATEGGRNRSTLVRPQSRDTPIGMAPRGRGRRRRSNTALMHPRHPGRPQGSCGRAHE